MESLPSLRHSHHQSLHPSLNRRHSTPFSSFPFISLPQLPPSSFSHFRLSPIRASHSNSPKNPSFLKPQNTSTYHVLETLNSLFSPLLKTTCIAAAIFFMRLHLKPPVLAVAAPLSMPPPTAPPENSSDEGNGSVAALLSTPPLAVDSTTENPSDEGKSSVEALQYLVESKLRERKIDEALGVIDRLIDLEPEESDWQLLKAHVCARSGEHASARDMFEEVLKRDPYCVQALHGLLMANAELKEPTKGLLPRLEEAVRFCESEKRDSEKRDLKLLIAQVKILKGELSGALNFRPYLCHGVVYTMMRKNDDAERQFEKFRGLVPEDHPYKEYFEYNANIFLQKLETEETAAEEVKTA